MESDDIRSTDCSAFADWFEAQHGKRPTMRGMTDEELEEMVEDGKRAKCVRDAQREYDARAESALYAWQAKDLPEASSRARQMDKQKKGKVKV